MSRSIWKGPFVDGYLLKKAEVARDSEKRCLLKLGQEDQLLCLNLLV